MRGVAVVASGGSPTWCDATLTVDWNAFAAGVVLTAASRVFDLVHERELAGTRDAPLEIPERAVVVPGYRPAKGDWARERGLGVACALITKYRDERTDRATALEEALR